MELRVKIEAQNTLFSKSRNKTNIEGDITLDEVEVLWLLSNRC